MEHKNELTQLFIGLCVNGVLPTNNKDAIVAGTDGALTAFSKYRTGKCDDTTKYRIACGIIEELLLNPYGLLEAGWGGCAEPGKDN